MKQTFRALSWLIGILSIVTILLPITIALSLSKLLEPNAIGVKEPNISLSRGTFTMSSPFYINNTGFYDLSDMNVTIIVGGGNQTISKFSEILPNVPAGKTAESNYNISFSLEELFSKNAKTLTDDSELNLGVSASFRIAYAITLGVSTNFTTSWGAPFYNLSVSSVTYDSIGRKYSVAVSFENHAYFSVNGPLLVEIYNSRGEYLGSVLKIVDVSSNNRFQGLYEIPVSDPSKVTTNGIIRFYLDGMQIVEKRWG